VRGKPAEAKPFEMNSEGWAIQMENIKGHLAT
jgi:hypothetical protein